MGDSATIRAALCEAASLLSDSRIPADAMESYVRRHQYELELVTDLKGTEIDLWDLGGGLGVFCVAASLIGIRATLVDDFADLAAIGLAATAIRKLESVGVHVIQHDFQSGPTSLAEDVDVVTTFHTIEHLHSSPRSQYQRVAAALATGGVFIVAGPNAVNLRKRLTAPFGRLEWSSMERWYYEPVFRAHVREPRAQDLLEIASDLGLEGQVFGKNFLGIKRGGIVGFLAKASGPILERRPTMCSDLYLVARKVASSGPHLAVGTV